MIEGGIVQRTSAQNACFFFVKHSWHTILFGGDVDQEQAALAGIPSTPRLLTSLLPSTHHDKHLALFLALVLFFCFCMA